MASLAAAIYDLVIRVILRFIVEVVLKLWYDLQPGNTRLRDYGKLLMDGQLLVRKDDFKVNNR